MNYTKGSLTVRIDEEFDEQNSKYVRVQVLTGEHILNKMDSMHFEDMQIVSEALNEYFDTSK